MKTLRERLEWAIRFAERDLDRFRPGDWLNLRDDLTAFLEAKGAPIPFPSPKELPESALRDLQEDVRALLGQVAPARPLKWRMVEIKGPLLLNVIAGPPAWVRSAGHPRDAVLLSLAWLLAADPSAVRRCPEPACHRLFYRVRRQVYCSTPCVKRANKRAERHAQWARPRKAKKGARR
ncbi:MAG TPA: hypothetical protein VGV13_14835 [Methylomirabilota bacterium]|jgi:hypothetical protein|nr:hypothetical protein [Methylomirabilota bacterium]